MSIVLGLGCRAGVGKDTVGDYLQEKYGWEKRSFAHNLKTCCMELFNLTDAQVNSQKLKNKELPSPKYLTLNHLNFILDWMSTYLGYKVTPNDGIFQGAFDRALRTPRDILQFIGTDIIRAHVPDYHIITCLHSRRDSSNYVICDVRFPNEGFYVNSLGYSVRIDRDTTLAGENKKHISENALDSWPNWSFVLDNTRNGLEYLYNNVELLLREVENARR